MVYKSPAWVNWFRLTRREYYADFCITPPLTLLALVVSLYSSWSWYWLPAFMAGWVGWTFYEYALHRWVLHKSFVRIMHGLHHKDPRDYIATHPAATIVLYAVFWLLFGFSASALVVGFSVGYCWYSYLHTAFHYASAVPGRLYGLMQHHYAHHRKDSKNFGVSTTFWDRAFRTKL